ncbi:MAG: sensor histidine kinase [Marinilabiliaceae bacterium]
MSRLVDFFKSHSPLLLHVLVWGFLFVVPLPYAVESPDALRFAVRNGIMLFWLMLTFYANYLWAIDKLLFKRRMWRFILFNVVLFFVLWFLRRYANTLADEILEHTPHRGKHDGMMSLFIINDSIFTILAICASLGVKHISSLHQLEIERKKLENETLASELSLLRYQIQPHFFFNCLNNIYCLIGSSPKAAQKAVHSLSKMMRFVLYDSSNTNIPLSSEIDFLQNYMSLMRLRLSDKAIVEASFPSDVEGVCVPSLVFIPLIENAFKHGVGPGGSADIKCVMSLVDCSVSFVVQNKVPSPGAGEDRSHSGIGLANLRKRLEILYGEKSRFSTSLDEDECIFRAEVVIPIAEPAKTEDK